VQGFYAHLDRKALFEHGDVYRIAIDRERAARAPVRVAILGAGGVAQAKYLPAIARLRMLSEPVEVVAVSTLDEGQRDKLSRIWRVPAYADSDALLREHAPDAVLITASDSAHCELTLAALAAGAHVIVEKPIACSLTEAAEMCRAAEAADRTLMTTCNKRYSPPYAEARRLLDLGLVREPSLFAAKFTLGYDYVDLLASGTVHVLDLARFLIGEIRCVSAIAAPVRRERSTIIITLEFASGAIGTIITTATALSLHPWERVEIFGDGAWFCVDDQATLTLHSGEYEPAQVWSPVIPNTLLSAEDWGGYFGMLEAFLETIRRCQPAAPIWDGYRALELVVATRQSLDRGGPVELPLDPVGETASD
jgi:predicted dehydrogenase